MRQIHLAILLAVPAANAFSLANFQSITSIIIPLSCQLTYDSQIQSCTKSDFNNGCSTACVAALLDKAADVKDACSTVIVSSNTLLGIVKGGGIVAALCPALAATSTTVKTTPSPAASQAPAVSVTIPTDSIGVTGGLGLKTSTSTTIATTTPVAQSILSSTAPRVTSTISLSIKTSNVAPTSTLQSADGGIGDPPPSTSTSTTTPLFSSEASSSKKGSVATSSKASAAAQSTPKGDAGTGGGSPFDIDSNSGASRIEEGSRLGMVVLLAFSFVLLGR